MTTSHFSEKGHFGLEDILEWATLVNDYEGTEVSAGDMEICVAHAILEAVALCDQNAASTEKEK